MGLLSHLHCGQDKVPLACGHHAREGVCAGAGTRACRALSQSLSAAGATSVPLALVSGHSTVLTITHRPDLPKPGVERASRPGKNNWKAVFC